MAHGNLGHTLGQHAQQNVDWVRGFEKGNVYHLVMEEMNVLERAPNLKNVLKLVSHLARVS